MSPGRRVATLLLAGHVVLVLWLCLSPFDFRALALEDLARAGRVEWIPFTHVCPTHGPWCLRDALRNVALYVPLGLLVAAAWPRGAWRWALAAAGLSAAMEVAQLFLPTRRPSTADLLANVAGAALGALVVALARPSPFRTR